MNDLETVLTDSAAIEVAKNIIERFNDSDDKQTIDYEFDLSKGKLVSEDINTNLKFDSYPDTFLANIRDTICGKEDMTKDDGDIILSFLIKIRDILNSEYKEQLKDIIRKKVLGEVDKEVFPLNRVQVINVEIGDLPDVDFLIVVQKSSPHGTISHSLSQELMNEHVETGKDLNDIIKYHQANGDEKYKYISGAYKRKYYFEYQVDMFVDYTPSADVA